MLWEHIEGATPLLMQNSLFVVIAGLAWQRVVDVTLFGDRLEWRVLESGQLVDPNVGGGLDGISSESGGSRVHRVTIRVFADLGLDFVYTGCSEIEGLADVGKFQYIIPVFD